MPRSHAVLVLFATLVVFAAPWPSAAQDAAPAPTCFDANDQPTCSADLFR